MTTKKIGSFKAVVFCGLLTLWGLGNSVYADDLAFLQDRGGSVYEDDHNFLGPTAESGFAFDENILDFSSESYSGPKTFLGFDGDLVDKGNGKAIPNAVVMLTGAGLPAQAKTDHNGRICASSTSMAIGIRVVINIVGYQPYSFIILRTESLSCGRNIMPMFFLTPLPPALHT